MVNPEKTIPEVYLSLVEAMSRQLPRSKFSIQMTKSRPNYFGMYYRGGNEIGDIIVRVNMQEYLEMYKKMIQDDRRILRYRKRFHPLFLEAVAEEHNVGLDTKEGRLVLIRHFFGLYDNSYFHFKYPEAKDVEEWFRERILQGYSQKLDPDDEIPPDYTCWYNKQKSTFLNLLLGNRWNDRKGYGRFIFNTIGEAMPVGDGLDNVRYGEMVRILNELKNDLHVSEIEILPGTAIRPTWKRKKLEDKLST